MAHQQLLEYIARELERGVTPQSLREALWTSGWKVVDIDEALRVLGRSEALPEIQQAPTFAGKETAQPTTEQETTNTNGSLLVQKPSRLKLTLLIVGVLVVLGIAAGAGYYYYFLL